MVRLVALSCLCSLVACAEPRTGGGVPAARSARSAPVLATTAPPLGASPAPGAATATTPDAPWVIAVRQGRYREVLTLLDALPPEDSRAPELRYVRARAAIALGEPARAKELLDGLEKDLPLLSREIARARADCALEVGPFDVAARELEGEKDGASLVRAALAWERAGDVKKSRSALDRALRAATGRSHADRSIRIDAHAARARIAQKAGDAATARVDVAYLLVEAPASEAARNADAATRAAVLAKLSPDERLLRARGLAEARRIDDALAELDALGKETPPRVSPVALTRARGYAYYLSRDDYRKAAALLDEAARKDPKERTKDTFYAARALSRAHDDEKAIERYEALAKAAPGTRLAEEARYQAARLRFLLGKWDSAIAGYRGYLDAFGKSKKRKTRGRFEDAARTELALALMGGKQASAAAPLFRSLSAAASDLFARANLEELEGAALAEAGETDRAAARLGQVVRERPLSLAALAASARLTRLGRPVPDLPPDAAAQALNPIVVELPEKVRLLSSLGFTRDAERELALREGEIIARYAPRGHEALCEAYGRIGGGAERYRAGQRAVKAAVLAEPPNGETRWAWDCVYPTPFEDVVRRAEEERALPPGLIHAVMRQESAFRADAVSPANAVGLLQLIPPTAEKVALEIGADHDPLRLRVPAYNVKLGAFYLRRVLDRFGGRVPLAAAAYNAGPHAVSRWLETGEELPLDVWVARIPYGETRGYVARVVGNLARYSYLQGGAAAVPKLDLDLPKGLRAMPGDY